MSPDPAEDRLATYGAIGGLIVLSASAAAYEIAPASVTPTIMAEMAVGEAAAGWLVGAIYLVAVVASVPIGIALDRTDLLRAVTAASIALLAAGVAGWAAAVAGLFPALVATRFLGGLAYTVIWNAGANLAGRSVPRSVQATAVGAFTASAPAGFALGQLGAPLVASVAGWPAIFPAFAAIAVAGHALFWWAMGRKRRSAESQPAAASPGPGAFRRVLGDRVVWTICGLGFAGYALYLFLNSWLPTFLGGRLGLTLAEGGLVVAVLPAVGVVARTGGGVLSDRVFAGRRRPVVLLSFVVAVPAVLALSAVGHVAVAVGLLLVGGAAIHLGNGLVFAYMREVVPEGVQATAVSLLTAVALSGAFLAPIGAGLLIEWSGAFGPAFLAAGAVGVAGAALALTVPEPGERAAQ